MGPLWSWPPISRGWPTNPGSPGRTTGFPVYIKAILPDRMKVKLNIIHRLDAEPFPEPLVYFVTAGRLNRWDYSPPGRAEGKIQTVFG